MRKKMWVFLCLVLMECYLAMARGIVVQEKADASVPVATFSPPDASVPVATFSPPEGNTTFIDGITWCVARPGVSQLDLQNALDWACGLGMSDCTAIQDGGPCFEPDTLLSHASVAFNNYYQANGNSDVACNFGGTATVTKNNPSYGKCVFPTSGSLGSSAPSSLGKHSQSFIWWKIAALLLLSYFWM